MDGAGKVGGGGKFPRDGGEKAGGAGKTGAGQGGGGEPTRAPSARANGQGERKGPPPWGKKAKRVGNSSFPFLGPKDKGVWGGERRRGSDAGKRDLRKRGGRKIGEREGEKAGPRPRGTALRGEGGVGGGEMGRGGTPSKIEEANRFLQRRSFGENLNLRV